MPDTVGSESNPITATKYENDAGKLPIIRVNTPRGTTNEVPADQCETALEKHQTQIQHEAAK